MLRIVQNRSSASAKNYFQLGDYYAEAPGRWGGKAAALLGLEGLVQKTDFDALCDNLHPQTGQPLTQRTATDRTVGYDFNFHSPKSVSILHALNGDERITEALKSAVQETMQEIETESQARVRKQGKNFDRTVGNLVWAEFLHTTSRPIDQIADPHLHIHAFTFNAVFDPEEKTWKAGQFRALKRDGAYYEAAFQNRFACKLQALGYQTERRGKSFELKGFSKTLIDRFSRRTREIEAFAQEKKITDPEHKAQLGAKTRESKSTVLSRNELQQEWRSRLSDEEFRQLIHAPSVTESLEVLPDISPFALKHAKDHCFERASVVPEKRLLEAAIRFGMGQVTAKGLKAKLQNGDFLLAEREGRQMATTREVLKEEQEVIRYARQSRGTLTPLNERWSFQRKWLNPGQQNAVRQLLSSSDRIQLLKGRAGTGKTTMMQEAIEGIEAGGARVFTFAPSAEASRGVLREKGFEAADTVARLCVDEKLQASLHGQVIWVDEAGLLGTKALKQVFDIAKQQDCRVILSGDWSQHSSVERGDAMRLLASSAGLRPAVLSEIQRQKAAYKSVVEAISEGKLEEGFRGLEQLGWIKEVADEERAAAIAQTYLESLEKYSQTLVISPTHAEGELTTQAIRGALQQQGKLSTDEIAIKRLASKNLTEAERRDPQSYEVGDMLVFQQNAPGHVKGERIEITQAPDAKLLALAQRFQVFRASEIPLAPGDLIRFTHNGTTLDQKHSIRNGATYHLAGFTKSGDLKLTNGWIVGRGFGHLSYGYCLTSHASQGKSVDHVILVQSGMSLGAASREQWYVSVSRGEKQCTVITNCAENLREAVSESDHRLTATEFQRSRRTKQVKAILRGQRGALAASAPRALDQYAHAREPTYDR